MGSVSVRVVPRSGRRAVELAGRRLVVRVRAAAEDGRATEEARRTLAEALGVPPGSVTLRVGRRSREKVFDVSGMTQEQAVQRLRSR